MLPRRAKRCVFAFDVPVAGLPVVVLVLQLDPPDTVDLLIDELFVTRGTVLGLLVRSLAQQVVLVWGGHGLWPTGGHDRHGWK